MKPKQEDSKEMVGGCCVCSDENGWTENPLVYCDGQGCTVAVHQACYGIVTVPTGSWFCRKCESQERAARVHLNSCSPRYFGDSSPLHPIIPNPTDTYKMPLTQSSGGRRIFSQRCELCPSKDGALKRTDSGGWAHVVCALYIPEVRFGNVTTMEPIMLQLIPQERFNKSCYICEENGKESRATIGACMQCNKSGCKQHFHVTCAQSMGLLCEEAGNYLDNVKYCGYCQYHFSKLRKGSHVKTIPPYRPVPHEAGASDEDKGGGDGRDPKLKKKTGRPHGALKPSVRDGAPGGSSSGLADRQERGHISASESTTVAPGSSGLVMSSSVVNSKTEGTPRLPDPSSVNSASLTVSVTKLNPSATINSFTSSSSSSLTLPTSSAPTFTTSLSSPLTTFSHVTSSTSSPTTTITSSSATLVSTLSNVITSASSSSVVTTAPSPSLPKTSEAHPSTTSSSHESPNQVSATPNSGSVTEEKDKDKQNERNRKLRRNGPRTPSGNSNFGDTESIVSNEDTQSSDLVLNICEEKNLSVEKESNKASSKPPLDSSDDGGSLNVQYTPNISSSKGGSDPFTPTASDFATSDQGKRGRSNSQERGRRPKRGLGKRGRPGGGRDGGGGGRDSGASSPDSFTSESAPKRGRKKADSKESLSSVITNGVGANTLLLGNQLNPTSADAQKMSDTLHAEIEAHSIYKEEDKISTLLVGPSLPGKKENANGSNGNTPNQPPPFPQSLEQLLERQWEQGSQFLMEQAQHFDIASLLSCLHQLREENVRLEETVSSLIARRDHLLAVNARLSVPLNSPTLGSNSSSSSSSNSNTAAPPTSSSSSATSAPPASSSIPSHGGNPRPTSSGSVSAPPRPHSQGHHPSGGGHSGGPAPPPGAGAGHRGTSPHDRRGPSPHERRGTSPHDRRAPPPQIPVENGLPEPEYRYRSPGTEHRQQSPMLPPGAQPSPTLRWTESSAISLLTCPEIATLLSSRHRGQESNYPGRHDMVHPSRGSSRRDAGRHPRDPSGALGRHSPASGNYHTSVSPHGVASLSPSGAPHNHPPPGHGPPPPPGHAPPSHGPPSHGSPHGPPHGPPHAPPPPMVSVAHSSAHSVAISRPSDHRGELVRLHPGPPPQHPGPAMGPGGYPVYQMVPGPHHSPVQPMNQPHPPPHAQVMRQDSARAAHGPLEKR